VGVGSVASVVSGLGGPGWVVSWVVAVAAVVLGAAGALKVVNPEPTAAMLTALRLPSGNVMGRSIGAVEVVVAAWVLGVGGWFSQLVLAGVYAGFAAGMVVLRRRSPATPCGCFGKLSRPPGRRHVAVNLAGAAAGIVGAITGAEALPEDAGTGATAVFVVLVVLGAVGTVVVMTAAGSGGRTRAGAPDGR